jgi:hypothetical protein
MLANCKNMKMICAPQNCVEVRVGDRLVTVPAMDIGGRRLVARGKRLRIATIRGDEMAERELENPMLYINELKGGSNQTLKADIFSFVQKLPATLPRYAYPMEWESVAAIHLGGFKQWWEALPQETRKNVRRSEKRGLVVKTREFDRDLIEGIRDINDESPLRQGMRNPYYGKSVEETKELYGEFIGRCDFICAYSGEELVAFLHLVYRGDVASILNLTTKASHFDKRPANALVAKAVEVCEQRGISYVTYGLYNYGNKRNSPLLQFKIRNGFEEIRVPRFYVPLTAWGAICVKLKLHRGLIGILPSSVISLVVDLRSKWYRSRFARPV